MKDNSRFKAGDVVAHPRRPEWGRGVVKSVRPVTHQGQSVQRLAVDFANKGRVVINTGVASLTLKQSQEPQTQEGSEEGQKTDMAYTTSTMRKRSSFGSTLSRTSSNGFDDAASSGNGRGWLTQLERASGNASHELWELPGAMTDPFASPRQRLEATLDSYRFSTEPRALMDWAVIQTGLDDPLTRYTRVELEQAFPRFARDRDQHLHDMVRRIKHGSDAGLLREVAGKLRHPAARAALQKAMRH